MAATGQMRESTMSLSASHETMTAIWDALNDAPPLMRSPPNAFYQRVFKEGWASQGSLEDNVFWADRRLDRRELKLTAFTEMLNLVWHWVFSRPHSRFDEPIGYQSLSAEDTAAVLILLERLGFQVDPEPLCVLLRPALQAASHVTLSGTQVLFHDKSQGRTAPITITANTSVQLQMKSTTVRLRNDYRAKLTTGDRTLPLWLTVSAPKYRPRPEPKSMKCDYCGMSYVMGLPSDDREHRKTHRAWKKIVEPGPDRKFFKARSRSPKEASWVDHRSPQWKYDLMYGRARAFKREMGYDFIQWPSTPLDDVEPIGFLFADDDGRIVGACGFRPVSSQPGAWAMDWIWLCPSSRRQGYLERHWPLFRSRFGDFALTHPLSAAMATFLEKHGLKPDAH